MIYNCSNLLKIELIFKFAIIIQSMLFNLMFLNLLNTSSESGDLSKFTLTTHSSSGSFSGFNELDTEQFSGLKLSFGQELSSC